MGKELEGKGRDVIQGRDNSQQSLREAGESQEYSQPE
jgi:hypothetical protein